MLTAAALFEHELKKLINEQIATWSENLSGGCAQDYAQYRQVIGFIAGLKEALALFQDAHKIADKSER